MASARKQPSRLKKTLPKNFDALVERGDLAALQAVFVDRMIDARGGLWKAPALSFYGVSEELMQWLINEGADIHCTDQYGQTPLHHLAEMWNGLPEVLLQAGADPNARDGSDRTPLFDAITHPQNVTPLLQAGARVDVRDEYGETPLEFRLSRTGPAEITQVTQSVELLVAAGAEVTDRVRELVREVGERFEEIREVYNPEELPMTEASLAKLYELTGTAPVIPVRKHDGVSPVRIADATASTDWPSQFNALWDYLVPAAGPAATQQGEASTLARSLSGGRASDDELYRIRELAVLWVSAQE